VSKTVYVLFRKIETHPAGQGVAIPLGTFASLAQAEQRGREVGDAMNQLATAQLVEVTPDRQGGVSTGITLRAFLAELGIANIGYFVIEQAVVDGPEIVVPKSGLILVPKH
jgi:hypothetical protein